MNPEESIYGFLYWSSKTHAPKIIRCAKITCKVWVNASNIINAWKIFLTPHHPNIVNVNSKRLTSRIGMNHTRDIYTSPQSIFNSVHPGFTVELACNSPARSRIVNYKTRAAMNVNHFDLSLNRTEGMITNWKQLPDIIRCFCGYGDFDILRRRSHYQAACFTPANCTQESLYALHTIV